MKEELTTQLYTAAPNLFGILEAEQQKLLDQLEGTSKVPFRPIAFGVECGSGWFDLLLECCTKLEAEILKLPEESRASCHVAQIKEKFGTLRFYMSAQTTEMSAIIAMAENKSGNTCESCGSPGKLAVSGCWFFTTCENHLRDGVFYDTIDADEVP